MNSLRSSLEREVSRFRAWADANPTLRGGEWECEYPDPDWSLLIEAVFDFISNTDVEDWDPSVLQLLLYTIARDNECERVAFFLRDKPLKLLALARASVVGLEWHAKWQLAVQLVYLKDHRPAAESLLRTFAGDADEYVRRRALMALGQIASGHVEGLVEPAWETGDQYQRMAVLDALYRTQSPKLGLYLDRADADGRQYLLAFSKRIRRGEVIG